MLKMKAPSVILLSYSSTFFSYASIFTSFFSFFIYVLAFFSFSASAAILASSSRQPAISLAKLWAKESGKNSFCVSFKPSGPSVRVIILTLGIGGGIDSSLLSSFSSKLSILVSSYLSCRWNFSASTHKFSDSGGLWSSLTSLMSWLSGVAFIFCF